MNVKDFILYAIIAILAVCLVITFMPNKNSQANTDISNGEEAQKEQILASSQPTTESSAQKEQETVTQNPGQEDINTATTPSKQPGETVNPPETEPKTEPETEPEREPETKPETEPENQATIPTIPNPEETVCTHSFGSWTVKVKATCEKTGTKTRSCSKCKHSETASIPKTDHTSVTVQGKSATCTATGLTDGRKCSVCKTVLVAQTTIPKKDHTFGSWTTTKEATCSIEGVKQRTCSVCKTVEKETIPVNDKHDYYYENCRDCGAKAKASENLKYQLSRDGTYYRCIGSTGSTVDVLVIPSSYNGKPVKEVGYQNNVSFFYAKKIILMEGITTINQMTFWSNRSIVEVYLPKSLTYIGGSNFRDCGNLTAVYVPTTGWKYAGYEPVDFSSPSGVVDICVYNANGYKRS